jgi:hypothetical protein
VVFSYPSRAKIGSGSQIMPRRLPSSSHSINYSLVILSFDSIQAISESLNNCKQKNNYAFTNTQLKFCSVVVVPVLLYGTEAQTLTSRDGSRLQAEEMRFLWAVKGCTRQNNVKKMKTLERN